MLLAGIQGCAGTSARESTGEYIDDGVITTKVKTALVKDKTVSAREISVETYKGTVQLSGFVASEDEKNHAETLTRTVGGVKAVSNGIVIR